MGADREWYELPIPAAMARLIEIRNELRQKNLHDTEEPPAGTPHGPDSSRGPHGADQRRHVQRSRLSVHGEHGHAVRPQRPARRDVPRHGEPAHAQSPHRQPRAVHAHHLPARDHHQRARGGVDSVPGARLVRAQARRADEHARHPALAPTTPGPSGRCASPRRRSIRRRSRVPPARRPTPTATLTGGTARRSTAATPRLQATIRTGQGGKIRVGADGRTVIDPATGLGNHRVQGQRLGRAEPAPRALRARAQHDLRLARARIPGVER